MAKREIKILNPIEGHTSYTAPTRARYYASRGRARFDEAAGTLEFTDGGLKVITAPQKQNDSVRKVGHSGDRSGWSRPVYATVPQTPEYLHWRESVLLRDNYKCVWCGATEHLEADHIKPKSLYPDLKYDVSNGRTLCHSCHVQTETYGAKVKRVAEITVPCASSVLSA